MTLAQQQAEAAAELAMWQAALAAILGGAQKYQIGGGNSVRILERADLAEVRAGRNEAQRRVDALASAGGAGVRLMRVMVRDT